MTENPLSQDSVEKRIKATSEVLGNSDLDSREILALVNAANSDPDKKTDLGQTAWKILNSIFDEIERKINKP